MSTKLNTQRMDMPVACDLSVFTPEERQKHIDESTELFTNARRVVEIHDGFSFHFDYSEALFLRLANWIMKDNKCCPFLTFGLVIEPFALGHEAILSLNGTDQMKQGLRADLEKLGIQFKD